MSIFFDFCISVHIIKYNKLGCIVAIPFYIM